MYVLAFRLWENKEWTFILCENMDEVKKQLGEEEELVQWRLFQEIDDDRT